MNIEKQIIVGGIYQHCDGLKYRVEEVLLCTDGYEKNHSLSSSRRIIYTQLEDGSYPAGTRWDKSEKEFLGTTLRNGKNIEIFTLIGE